jgi:hypothetical protein
MLEEYKKDQEDNPEEYWFKAKNYGWGWTPVKWQGWVVTLGFVGFIVWSGINLGEQPTDKDVNWFLVKIFVSIVMMVLICLRTGEKPKWRWGYRK